MQEIEKNAAEICRMVNTKYPCKTQRSSFKYRSEEIKDKFNHRFKKDLLKSYPNIENLKFERL